MSASAPLRGRPHDAHRPPLAATRTRRYAGRVSRRAPWLLVLATATAITATASACTNVGSIGAGSGRVCQGPVIGTSDAAFIRRGFCESVTLELVFRPVMPAHCRGLGLETASPYEALLTTSDHAFECAPVHIVGPVEQDLLGRYDFPGDTHLENKIYTVRRTRGPDDGSVHVCSALSPEQFDPASACGQDATLFVSFVDTGGVEVRILAGAGDSSTGERCSATTPDYSTGRDLFGVFRLTCTQ